MKTRNCKHRRLAANPARLSRIPKFNERRREKRKEKWRQGEGEETGWEEKGCEERGGNRRRGKESFWVHAPPCTDTGEIWRGTIGPP